MDQLSDLDDDCFIAVLDRLPPKELFKIIGVNRRLKRLAVIVLQGKIKAINLSPSKCGFNSDKCSFDCAHPDFFSQDQVLVLWPTVRHKPVNASLFKPSISAIFLSILTKCAGVKSVDFDNFELPCDLLPEIFRLCPELECVKFVPWEVEIEKWERALDQIGHRINHLAKNFCYKTPSDAKLLKIVAAKCPNIKQIDWVLSSYHMPRDLFAAFKILSETCWIRLKSLNIEASFATLFQDVFQNLPDVVNELDVYSLCWSSLGHRYDRLSSLKFCSFSSLDDGIVHGVEFAGLKRLEIEAYWRLEQHWIDCLIASSFPRLEEFCFNTSYKLPEADFDALFRRMASVKKLIIVWMVVQGNDFFKLSQSAIKWLTKLETIDLEIRTIDDKQPTNLLQLLEQYVDGIGSLKKLIVRKKNTKENDEWEKTLEDEIKRLKLKQNHVEVVLINMKLS